MTLNRLIEIEKKAIAKMALMKEHALADVSIRELLAIIELAKSSFKSTDEERREYGDNVLARSRRDPLSEEV